MDSQRFTHENEMMAFAPLKDDPKLFSSQRVWINGAAEVQWDFTLPNGKAWHFAQRVIFFRCPSSLEIFKDYIKDTLIREGA